MLAAPFFDDEAEVDGYASDDEPEDESSGGLPSSTGLYSSDEGSVNMLLKSWMSQGLVAEPRSYRGYEDTRGGQLSPTVGR